MKGGYDMNLYILVEDGKSGHKIIDHWIPTLLPTLTRVPTINEMTNNQYVIFSGLGYPRILGTDATAPGKNVLGQTIDTINDSHKIDYLLIFLDGDNEGLRKRTDIVTQKINNYPHPLTCPFVIFVQNKCLETWLLGNQNFFPTNPSQKFLPFVKHYNVATEDPEQMENDMNRRLVSTSALYHERYLRQMMQDMGHRYSKSRPASIIYTPEFIEGLKKRIEETNHLPSLHLFFEFIEQLKKASK